MFDYQEVTNIMAMITKDKITEIFCIADDFCKKFDVEIAKQAALFVHSLM